MNDGILNEYDVTVRVSVPSSRDVLPAAYRSLSDDRYRESEFVKIVVTRVGATVDPDLHRLLLEEAQIEEHGLRRRLGSVVEAASVLLRELDGSGLHKAATERAAHELASRLRDGLDVA